ncbi:MAG: oligosaccharide flippase family protein [Acidimicrobiia bacterium]
MNVGRQAISLGVTLMLAGLLGPRAMGTVAMATVFVAFVQMLLQQGMGAALVQRCEVEAVDLDVAFWMVMGSGAALAGITAVLSGWWAGVNGLPELEAILLALTPLVLLRALLVVPDAVLRRQLRFRPLALRTNASVLAGGISGAAAALAGFGAWALVVQQLLASAVEVIVVWRAVTWRPAFRWSSQTARNLVSFTAPSAAASLAIFVSARADTLIMGLLLGPVTVGLYRFAGRLIEMITEAVVGSVRAVALPELARHRGHPEVVAQRLVELVGLTAAAAIIPLTAVAATSESIFRMVGPEWAPAAGALPILALAAAGRTIGDLSGPSLQAAGRPGALAAVAWCGAVLSAATLVTAGVLARQSEQSTQIMAVAVAMAVLHGGLFLGLNAVVISRCLRMRVGRIAAALLPAVIASVGGYHAGRATEMTLPGWPPPVRVAMIGATAALCTTLNVAVGDRRIRRTLAQLFRREHAA